MLQLADQYKQNLTPLSRAETGIIQVISSNSSCSLDELADVRKDGQTLMWQFYVAADRVRAEKTLKKAVNLDMKSIWVTVDAPVVSLRAVSLIHVHAGSYVLYVLSREAKEKWT